MPKCDKDAMTSLVRPMELPLVLPLRKLSCFSVLLINHGVSLAAALNPKTAVLESLWTLGPVASSSVPVTIYWGTQRILWESKQVNNSYWEHEIVVRDTWFSSSSDGLTISRDPAEPTEEVECH